jgi:hypothetical protein
MLPSRHTRYELRWLVGSSGENLYLSYPEDPQSEVTPLTVPANARSELTGRLGGPLRRGATFGALALVCAGTLRGRRGIACRGLVVVGGHGALDVAPRARGQMTTTTLVELSSLMRASQSPREGRSAMLAVERMYSNHMSTSMNKMSDLN